MIVRIALVLVLLAPHVAAAQSTVIVVRHAERADAGGTPEKDPGLSEAGRARAASLAAMLKDAQVTRVFVTEFQRTQQTAAPLANAAGIAPEVVPAADVAGLVSRIAAAAGNVLVVGHSNTVPAIVKALGAGGTFTIAESEFDNLIVVRRGPSPELLRLRYR